MTHKVVLSTEKIHVDLNDEQDYTTFTEDNTNLHTVMTQL